MALDLEGYIKQSYMRPNRKILEDLGASPELIEYLMETPGNLNWQIVEAIEGAGSGDEWTSFRLHAAEINLGQESDYYVLQGMATDYETLFSLADRDDLIIAASYNISIDGTNINNSDDVYLLIDASKVGFFGDYALGNPLLMLPTGHVVDTYYGIDTDYEIDYYGCSQYMNVEPTNWLEIKYKTGTHYTLTLGLGSDITTWNMAPGQKWITPESYAQYGYKLTDGTNTWNFGEAIIPTSDMNLTVVMPGN